MSFLFLKKTTICFILMSIVFTTIEYDDEKIYFTFSIYMHARPDSRLRGSGTPASVSSLTEEFPFPKRFEIDLKKLQQELHLYDPFSL